MTKALIRYVRDYDTKEEHDGVRFMITTVDGRNEFTVSISEGESVEFLMAETLAQLEEIRAASVHGWNPARRFSELRRCIKLDAREAFDEENIFEIMRVSSIVLDTKDFEISRQDSFEMEKYLNMRIRKIKNNSAFFWSEMTEEEKDEEVNRTIQSIRKII